MNEKEFTGLITFWRNVEAFSPQEVPKLAPSDPREPTKNWEPGEPAPWSDHVFQRRQIPADRVWRYSIYAGLYERPRYIEMLEARLGKQQNVVEERPTGHSCVFAIAVGEDGRPLPETFMLSMAAWAYGIVETHGIDALSDDDANDITDLHAPETPLDMPPSNSGFPGFDRQLDRLREELAWRLGGLAEGASIDGTWFGDFANLVINKCHLQNLFGAEPVHRIKCSQLRRQKVSGNDKPARSEDDFLNSFFIKDLNRLIDAKLSRTGEGMRRYLAHHADIKRIDVRKDRDAALDLLAPSNFPEGCWPAEHPLVWSQQVAINALWRDLRDGSGTFAVNGPPGTGKTTLLRDIVAAIIVQRAKQLAAAGTTVFGDRRKIESGKKSIPYYAVADAISGYSIVVASSNNGAVENVSLELPKLDAIHHIWTGSSNAYPDLATELLGQPAWALVAGRLGNKQNRADFVNKFWWGTNESESAVTGLRARLDAIAKGKESPTLPWNEAVAQFRKCLKKEDELRREVGRLRELPKLIATLERQQTAIKQQMVQCHSERLRSLAMCDSLMEQVADSNLQLAAAGRKLENLKTTRPGILDWISTLGESHRQWRREVKATMANIEEIEKARKTLDGHLKTTKREPDKLGQQLAVQSTEAKNLSHQLALLLRELSDARAKIGQHWPDKLAPDADQEKSSPWAHPEWRTARIGVFLAALNLHRAFIESNPRQMFANLGLAMDVLGGAIPGAKERKIGLDSLALACPVISTTFASVSSLFGEMTSESIGWLLIDEAGQATPQAAAGAIWRSRRIVVVGDPLQLEPVVTLPRTVEVALAGWHGAVNARWHPSRTSVQTLADHATPIGTLVGEGEDAIWVGAPLRVHRRCDDPMFSVSNTIAYNGMMVHRKPSSECPWPASIWIDVLKMSADGNWIPSEGVALETLLTELIEQHQVPREGIFLISPFRDVVRRLYGIGKRFQLDDRRVGTVHTTQGKEADVVILVLGGGTASSRNWAASAPNLLNVAVSRAKKRLYVIGDKRGWSGLRYFDVLSQYLSKHEREELVQPGLS